MHDKDSILNNYNATRQTRHQTPKSDILMITNNNSIAQCNTHRTHHNNNLKGKN